MASRYYVETFGCQMNEHDSERLAGLLDRSGYVAADHELDADIVVLNTCSVREKAEDKLYSRVGAIRTQAAERGQPSPLMVVAGCVAQQEGEALLKGPTAVDVVVGTQSMVRLPALIGAAIESGRRRIDIQPYDDVSYPIGGVRHSDPVRAWVTIIEGCNEFCSFCVVPYTRGHERMRPAADIVADVERAAASGHVEVQLLGQIVNHYQAPDDPACDFGALLSRVARVPAIQRVRFASPHPRHVTETMLEAVRTEPKVCKHLHLPLQSGSDAILERMRRRHTAADYRALVDRARAVVPGISLSTDIIVGFPGETDQDFDNTYAMVERVRFHAMFSFKYSPRPQTLAEKRLLDDVPEAAKTKRIVALQALQKRVQGEIYAAAVGTIEPVLADTVSRRRESELSGRTSGNTVVNFAGAPEWIGRVAHVRITDAAPNSLRGEIVSVDMGVPVSC